MQNGVVVIGIRTRESDQKIDDCFSDKSIIPLSALEAITTEPAKQKLPLQFFNTGDPRVSRYRNSGFRAYVIKEDRVYKDQSLLEQQT
ncbi:hypothetical protein HYX05_02465 [Candidatus Woesearchaeota archaeon]|nr:hypothetical protein [Candidatus Woesearchaeota archaeon]